MTSRAVLHVQRSANFDRRVVDCRRWKFFDVVASYCPKFRLSKRNTEISVNALAGDRCVRLGGFYSSNASVEGDTEFTVELTCEGEAHENIAVLATQLQEDALEATKELLFWHRRYRQRFLHKEVVELTVMLTDDAHIRQLNKEFLDEDRPTDVLSFPMDGTEEDHLPVMLLGDILISLDTAERQARQMQHSIRSECRILLVHALLHLFGYDHDRSEGEWMHMAEMEQKMLTTLGWTGSGLITAVEQTNTASGSSSTSSSSEAVESVAVDRSRVDGGTKFKDRSSTVSKIEAKEVKLVALDMDGTLLTSDQRISDTTREAVREAIDRGVTIVVATGKARSGAVAACRTYGLYGDRGLISEQSPGIFLQGLDVYKMDGRPIKGPNLAPELVRSAFEYAKETGTSIVGFSGDHCFTLDRTRYVLDLHERYFEPLAEVMPSLDAILQGPPIQKIVFLSDIPTTQRHLQPLWDRRVKGTSSQTVLAVPDMLEIVPRGTDKWIGLASLLESMSLSPHTCMAIGDGKNDYQMIKNVGLGVAMGNAVEDVKSVADHVVASNDEDGVAEAFQKFLFF